MFVLKRLLKTTPNSLNDSNNFSTFLQPQKKERQATPKKTPTVKVEDEEYAGSTDVDEPGWFEFTVMGGKKYIF